MVDVKQAIPNNLIDQTFSALRHTGSVLVDARGDRQKPWRLIGLAAIGVGYLLLALIHWHVKPPHGGLHFVLLAEGWLQGHLYVAGSPGPYQDYTFYRGHWYVAFPPLPAVLLLPLVALFHEHHAPLYNYAFSIFLSLINIILLFWVLKHFARYRSQISRPASLLLLLFFFALGSEYLYVSLQGSVWFMAHVVATTFILLYVGECLGRRRALLSGFWLGLAFLARATALLLCPLFLLLELLERGRERPARTLLARWLAFALPPLLCVLGMLIYNKLRFDSFLDFGYTNMSVNAALARDLHTYGQFSLHYLGRNLHYMLFEPFHLQLKFPFVTFNPKGTGIFFTMPFLLLSFCAFCERGNRPLALALLLPCLLTLVPLLLYFNTGWWQFGWRFCLDFLPCALLLAALGLHRRTQPLAYTSVIASAVLNVIGAFSL
uniref:Glycosyltransferase RgtA/B/C/D-like domain-containing protein n=1 Tax=Thermogemmatispora argillosa TaxID=2045280 RepID=A0A455T1B8_9CHLR|nr:hypothetical protein KTA_18570 [Thermogemmatispora argillosa]